jgi:hypothetical protein
MNELVSNGDVAKWFLRDEMYKEIRLLSNYKGGGSVPEIYLTDKAVQEGIDRKTLGAINPVLLDYHVTLLSFSRILTEKHLVPNHLHKPAFAKYKAIWVDSHMVSLSKKAVKLATKLSKSTFYDWGADDYRRLLKIMLEEQYEQNLWFIKHYKAIDESRG